MTVPTTKSSSSGHFLLHIDGHKATTFLKTVSGGWAKAGLIDDGVGPQSGRVKHLGPVEIEPISVELGLSGANSILKWIQGSWRRQWSRRNGQITHADFNLKQTFVHEFFDALMLEATFPALDATSKEAAYLKCKFLPWNVQTTATPGSKTEIKGEGADRQKYWLANSFRFRLDQVEGMEYTSKIDALTVKQGVKKMFTGKERLPQIEPTKIEFPNIVGYMSLAHAAPLLKWHNEYVFKGRKDPRAQLSGCIEFLSPDRKTTIYSINLFEAGLLSAHIEDAQANAEQIKRVKFEIFVGHMDVDGPANLALD